MSMDNPKNCCSGCGEDFNGVSLFDQHRVGKHGVDRRCLTTDEMLARGWRRNRSGRWTGGLLDPSVFGKSQK